MNKPLSFVIAIVLLVAAFYWIGSDGPASRSSEPAVALAPTTDLPRQQGQSPAVGRQLSGPMVAQRATAQSAATALPAAPEATANVTPDRVRLWSGPFEVDTTDQVEAVNFRMEPRNLEQLRTGQQLDFILPDSGEPITAELRSTANQGAEVQIWQGPVLDRDPQDNLIIARGPQQTHITVFTDATTYSVVVDNATGEASLVDEGDIHENAIPYEDGIALPEVPDTLPPL